MSSNQSSEVSSYYCHCGCFVVVFSQFLVMAATNSPGTTYQPFLTLLSVSFGGWK